MRRNRRQKFSNTVAIRRPRYDHAELRLTKEVEPNGTRPYCLSFWDIEDTGAEWQRPNRAIHLDLNELEHLRDACDEMLEREQERHARK